MQFITLLDFFLLPFYAVIIYLIAFRIRDRYYPAGHPWRAYFVPGLTVKLVGGLFIGVIYQYYYGGGDTSNYFIQAKTINSSFMDSPFKWLQIMLHTADWWDPDYSEYISQIFWYRFPANYIVCSATALVGMFCFTTYLPCTLILAALAYTGIWAMFRTFAKQYPSILRYIAVACLFIPSVFMWGSGIFKDTLCLFGLGWLTHIVFRVFVERRISLGNLIMLILCFYVLYVTKIYILIAYLPSLMLWVLLNYSARIPNRAVRALLQFTVIGICLMGFVVANQFFAADLGQYSLEKISQTSTVTRDYIAMSSGSEGSSYDLGPIDPSPLGMLKKLPQAINVTLFRPYIWEARKPIVMLNALEATIIMLLTLKVLFGVGLGKIYRAIASDANIQFCLIFSLIFAFAVGISSYNFGTLSRYRIPCLPMYVLALILIYYKYNSPQKSIFKLQS
jgi:hypothetical protein